MAAVWPSAMVLFEEALLVVFAEVSLSYTVSSCPPVLASYSSSLSDRNSFLKVGVDEKIAKHPMDFDDAHCHALYRGYLRHQLGCKMHPICE
jgi:hypothetical protein